MAAPWTPLDLLVAAWVSLVGAVIGSFLNVVIARVPAGESIVRPRSRCPRCGAPIAWYDNVPVVSWLLLRARCRACAAPISPRYPLVEAAVAAAALLAWSRHGLSGAAAAELVLVALLVALALIDLDTWLLPHALTWPLLAAGVLANALAIGPAATLASSAAGAAVGFGAFALIALVAEKVLRKEALGFGDVWLLAALGAWFGLPALLPIVLLASIQGSVIGILLVLLGRGEPGPPVSAEETRDAAGAQSPSPVEPDLSQGTPADEEEWVPPRNAVPFGPFLALGAAEWLYLAEWLARAVPALGVFR